MVFGRDLITGSPPGPVRAARHKWRPARPLTSRRRASRHPHRAVVYSPRAPPSDCHLDGQHTAPPSPVSAALHTCRSGGGGGGGGGAGARAGGCTAGVSALSDSKYNFVPLYSVNFPPLFGHTQRTKPISKPCDTGLVDGDNGRSPVLGGVEEALIREEVLLLHLLARRYVGRRADRGRRAIPPHREQHLRAQ